MFGDDLIEVASDSIAALDHNPAVFMNMDVRLKSLTINATIW